jgi:hypothetical protein
MKAVTAVRIVAMACVAVAAVSSCGGARERGMSATRWEFNRDIRPILSENCFRCHGPDAEMRKAGLRLDLPDPAYGVLPKMPGHHAIVPGKPDQSELVHRITSTDPDYRMPHRLAPLSAAQIATLKEWIQQGAPYERQWALVPPKNYTSSSSKYDSLAVNDIDRFVFTKLVAEGLAPSKEADRPTLIRRVSLTLTGLPPTLAEVDAFVNDESPSAYEKVVDRLLASPAYGEQMAANWMDLARWANTDGYLDDHHDRLLWPWRDWVIQAFNANMPYNEFGTWQLAGDLLPTHTRDQVLATAFLRLGQRTTENGALNEDYRIHGVVDQVNTVGTAFLGYTVGCAECHDHKYDPISQKDYYSFSGFFNSLDVPGVYAAGFTGLQAGPTLPWPAPQQQQQMDEIDTDLLKRISVHAQALSAASEAAQPQVAAMLGDAGTPRIVQTSLTSGEPNRLNHATELVRDSLDKAMVAYYPFDSVEAIPPKAYPTLQAPAPPLPPAGLMIALKQQAPAASLKGPPAGAAAGPAQLMSRAPPTYTLEYMRFSPAGMRGVAPAIIQQPDLRPGVKGNALYFTATNKGYFARGVGDFDRTQPFSFDFWFYPGQKYPTAVPIFDHNNVNDADTWLSATSGYELDLSERQQLRFYLSHIAPHNMIVVSTKQVLPLKRWAHIAVTYDGSSKAAGLHIYVDGKLAELDVVRDNLTRSIVPLGAAAEVGASVDPCEGLAFGTRFRQKAPQNSALDEFRVFDRDLTPLEVSYLNEGDLAFSDSGEAEAGSLAHLLAIRAPQVQSTRRALNEVRAQENRLASSIPEVLVAGDTHAPLPAYLLNRGLYDQRREQVPTQGLEQLFPWDSKLPRNRIGLANWLFDPHNPLTARVFVNRIWQMNFGVGLVKTAQDFGSQGAVPTHPQLLDWLAIDFMNHGWTIKRLQKMMVMSATYRQDSNPSQALLTRDPANELLARGPRFRMTGRMIRDSALEDSGLLVQKIGGPDVYPYQPDSIWNAGLTFYTYPNPGQIPAAQMHRRTLYTFVKRNAMNPQLQVLDAADPTVSIARLSVSNTPMQSLLLLNSPQYEEAYRMMAQRTLEAKDIKAGDVAGQLTLVFRLARQQYPDAQQLSILRKYHDQRIQHYQADPAAAASLENIGVAPMDKSLDPSRVAVLTDVAALIMNTPDSYFVR